MTQLIALPPSAEQIAEGSLQVPMHAAGGDSPPVIEATGPYPGGYHFRQNEPATKWGPIKHSLGRYPGISADISIGTEAIVSEAALVVHNSVNEVTIYLPEPGMGDAWLA